MPLAGDIGKVCYSVMLLLEIKSSLQDIDNNLIDQSKQSQQNNSTNNSLYNNNNTQKTQFLLILAAITFSILCFSMYKVYKAWKYLELYNIFSDRNLGHNPQRRAVDISSNNIRQRAKSTDGLNEVELQTLKKTQFEAIQLEPKQSQPSQTCSICFLEIENKSSIYELECKHMFHSECLDTWLKNKNSCPNCRSKVIQRSQLVIQSLEDSDISISTNSNTNNNDQLFQQIMRQNGDLIDQQIIQIGHSDIHNQNENQEEGQIYNPQPSIGNIVDADEENHIHHIPRTSDNLQYSSQQYLQAAHY
ncbi:zinc finger, C3HC4 type (RING finger) protein (macronuclear) [Tetrahymena thermophila SB210]|uniref:Zinc finger, C3HC4 type (RING finger) protein n=1 Tax=Tetrahymena thermophila (strain SB210) TaxID=312017 RepID=Q22X69_TETTS|nr:zinc finger, C3HC4 type (RING finger) protein [Tetrahymena thermophila SB210]EAR89777.2 zinc finger, C3HC4 type (RING finger) protein [Tetrahymena thermophila SB210]|eukprot:XP_001010022.2 zinc finger, C3HC4 type (RING finger) protein [Tetrahymena thermophila SB210]